MYQKLVISSIREEIPDFKTFSLEAVPGQEIRYKPGQYLTLLHPKFPEEIRRSYSIVSTPALNEPLTIGVKRIENGIYSRFLIDEARPGDVLLTIGAAGFFTLPEDLSRYRQLFFLAAGSGITPIFSLLKTVLYQHSEIAVVLIYSNSSAGKTIFKTQLEELAEAFPEKFRLEFIYSNSPDLARAHLHRELLVWFLKKYAVTSPENTLAFTCGPQDYMRMCTYGFRNVGIPEKNIRKEIFNLSKAIPKVEPPDKEQHLVSLLYKNRKYDFPVQFPVSILSEAKKQGISLPYSCEAGRCGNCVARCVEGNVWMSYNEVLTKGDLEKGLILSCVGFPINGNVTLEIL